MVVVCEGRLVIEGDGASNDSLGILNPLINIVLDVVIQSVPIGSFYLAPVTIPYPRSLPAAAT